MSKYIPVDPDKWCDMVKAQAEVDVLRKENERLQADIKRLATDSIHDMSEIAELRAEVERLRKNA